MAKAKKLVFPLIAVLSLGLAASFNGCSCGAEAKVGNNQPQPPPPPPPPPPPASTPPPPPPPPPPHPTMRMIGKAKVEGTQIKIPGEVEFDIDKASIKNTSQTNEILDTVGQVMKANPNITLLRIEGHTDNTGTADHNMTLSQARADAVATYLATKGGIDKGRLHTVGFGQTQPIAPNDTPDNRQKNRRTAFHIEQIDGKPAPADNSSTTTTSNPSMNSAGSTAAGAASGTTASTAPSGSAAKPATTAAHH